MRGTTKTRGFARLRRLLSYFLLSHASLLCLIVSLHYEANSLNSTRITFAYLLFYERVENKLSNCTWRFASNYDQQLLLLLVPHLLAIDGTVITNHNAGGRDRQGAESASSAGKGITSEKLRQVNGQPSWFFNFQLILSLTLLRLAAFLLFAAFFPDAVLTVWMDVTKLTTKWASNKKTRKTNKPHEKWRLSHARRENNNKWQRRRARATSAQSTWRLSPL